MAAVVSELVGAVRGQRAHGGATLGVGLATGLRALPTVRPAAERVAVLASAYRSHRCCCRGWWCSTRAAT